MSAEGKYKNFSLKELERNFIPVNIHGTNVNRVKYLSSGQQIVFWVAGDGERTFVYFCTGWGAIMPNNSFVINSVLLKDPQRSVKGTVKDGMYLYKDGDTEKVLGKVSPCSRSKGDNVTKIARSYLIDNFEEVKEEQPTSTVVSTGHVDEECLFDEDIC